MSDSPTGVPVAVRRRGGDDVKDDAGDIGRDHSDQSGDRDTRSAGGHARYSARAAGWLLVAAIGAAGVTLVAWMFLRPGDHAFAIERAITVLVIACPPALALAIPLVERISASLGARHGVLIRSRSAMAKARHVGIVVYKMTGILTEGRRSVADVTPCRGVTVAHLLALAASVEAGSAHPIARAILDAGTGQRGLRGSIVAVPEATEFAPLAGRGAQAMVGGQLITVGSARLVAESGLPIDADVGDRAARQQSEGKTVVFVMTEEDVLGAIAIADVIRPESAEAVARLRKRGIRVAILSGDSHQVGDWVAAQLGIAEVFAEVLPADRSAVIGRLQSSSTVVAMVGDGLNDVPSLTQADIGIAIGAGTDDVGQAADLVPGAGTDAAGGSANIILASGDPRAVAAALQLSRVTYRTMRQNVLWATGSVAVAIPLGAAVTSQPGLLPSPALVAVLVGVSVGGVAINALKLRFARL